MVGLEWKMEEMTVQKIDNALFKMDREKLNNKNFELEIIYTQNKLWFLFTSRRRKNYFTIKWQKCKTMRSARKSATKDYINLSGKSLRFHIACVPNVLDWLALLSVTLCCTRNLSNPEELIEECSAAIHSLANLMDVAIVSPIWRWFILLHGRL